MPTMYLCIKCSMLLWDLTSLPLDQLLLPLLLLLVLPPTSTPSLCIRRYPLLLGPLRWCATYRRTLQSLVSMCCTNAGGLCILFISQALLDSQGAVPSCLPSRTAACLLLLLLLLVGRHDGTAKHLWQRFSSRKHPYADLAVARQQLGEHKHKGEVRGKMNLACTVCGRTSRGSDKQLQVKRPWDLK